MSDEPVRRIVVFAVLWLSACFICFVGGYRIGYLHAVIGRGKK